MPLNGAFLKGPRAHSLPVSIARGSPRPRSKASHLPSGLLSSRYLVSSRGHRWMQLKSPSESSSRLAQRGDCWRMCLAVARCASNHCPPNRSGTGLCWLHCLSRSLLRNGCSAGESGCCNQWTDLPVNSIVAVPESTEYLFMSHSLGHRVGKVQTAARRLLCLHGLARFVVATVLVVAALGLIDYGFRLHNPMARWLLSICAVALLGVAFVKLALRQLVAARGQLATARRIEHRFPELGERLSSAIAFLKQADNDPTAGSPALRRAVIAEAVALSAELDFRDALDAAPVRGAVIAATAALVVAGLFASANYTVSRQAMARLAQPWRELSWPR